MKKHHLLKMSAVCVAVISLAGCIQFQPFTPKELKPEAKGISTVRSTPYGCVVLGEVEGEEHRKEGFSWPTYAQARQSAMNDLRNNAVDVIGKTSKRVTLRITDEHPICSPSPMCLENLQEHRSVDGFRVNAQVFECGDKK